MQLARTCGPPPPAPQRRPRVPFYAACPVWTTPVIRWQRPTLQGRFPGRIHRPLLAAASSPPPSTQALAQRIAAEKEQEKAERALLQKEAELCLKNRSIFEID